MKRCADCVHARNTDHGKCAAGQTLHLNWRFNDPCGEFEEYRYRFDRKDIKAISVRPKIREAIRLLEIGLQEGARFLNYGDDYSYTSMGMTDETQRHMHSLILRLQDLYDQANDVECYVADLPDSALYEDEREEATTK